jgi:transposase
LTDDRESIMSESVTGDIDALGQRLGELQREQERLQQSLQSVERARDEYRALYQQMPERCRKLERGLFGQKAERLPVHESQLALAVLASVLGEQAGEITAAPVEEVRAHQRKKPTGRNVLPEEIPRVEIEIVPDQVQREGLDAFERIGQDTTEVLERRPASMVVVRIIKPKFVRKDRGRNEPTAVLVGSTPELPIPRSVAGPGMLADTVVKRWQDHLPLNRLEGIYAREGIQIARSTMCGWHEQASALCEPLVAAMRADALVQPYLCIDATGVLVQAKEKCRTGHFWVIVAPKRHVLFEFTRSHDSDAVDTVLAGYEGYLVADAHVVYDHLYADGSVVEVNCWAHCRRYFFKALESDPERAKQALGYIGALFRIERSIKTAPRKKRERIRDKHSQPIVEAFYSWCDAQWPALLEDSPIYDGVRYARNQRVGLQRFLEDGRLPLHNNDSELNLRRQAIGRKNWLFVGSDDGARANAVFTSLLASCRMLGVEPWSYLRDILCLLPRWQAHRLLEIVPVNWSATSQRDDVRALLAADPYRTATLQRA